MVLPAVHMKTDFSLQRYENTESQKITLTVAKSHSFPLVNFYLKIFKPCCICHYRYFYVHHRDSTQDCSFVEKMPIP